MEFIEDSAELSGSASSDESEGSCDNEDDNFIDDNQSDDSEGGAHRQCDNQVLADIDTDDNSDADGSDADGNGQGVFQDLQPADGGRRLADGG